MGYYAMTACIMHKLDWDGGGHNRLYGLDVSQSSGGWVPVSVLTAEVIITLLGGITYIAH